MALARFFEGHPVRSELEEKFGARFAQRLGSGGFNEVWQVSIDGADLALKISKDPLEDSNGKTAKELEALEIAKVDAVREHPYIVSFFGMWMIQGHLVTRWELGSQSLADVLKQAQAENQQGLSRDELLAESTDPPGYMLQIASALDCFNQIGHIHRDVKPDNILLFAGRYAKIADLGLAAFITASTYHHSASAGLGTPGYSPPEAQMGRWDPITSDLYGLVATYVKLRTGREPFGETWSEIYRRQQDGNPVVDGMTAYEASLVRQALAADPKDRPQQGAAAFFRALARADQNAAFVMPEPAAVQIAEIHVDPMEVRVQPVQIAIASTGELPPVSEDIIELLSRKRGLAEAIEQLEAEKHSSLRPGQSAVERAEQQFQQLDADLQANQLELPGDIAKQLSDELHKNPAASVTGLCALSPSTPHREMLNHILRLRNVSLADHQRQRVRSEYEAARQQQIADLLKQSQQVEVNLHKRQLEDFAATVGDILSRCGNPPYFPIDAWLAAEALLKQRHYPWPERELLRMGEALFKRRDMNPFWLALPPRMTNALGMEFVLILPGEFTMGSPEDESGRNENEKQHRVRITKPYFACVHPVTVDQFRRFVDATGFRTEGQAAGDNNDWTNPGFQQGPDHPVVRVSWNDAVAFAKWLSESTGQTYRLFTEAEWEYAARCGQTEYAAYCVGDGKNLTHNDANYDGKYNGTTPVDKFPPNAIGLHDFPGNVWEWCADIYDDKFYANSPIDDPICEAGSSRVLRGGCWGSNYASFCRSACRGRGGPSSHRNNVGFRLLRVY